MINNSNVVIRKVNEDDVDNNFLNIFIQGYKTHQKNRPDMFKLIDTQKAKKILLEFIEESNVLVMMKNNIIIGYTSYQIKEKITKVLWVDELVIDEKYRNNGYGNSLMKELENIAKEENCDSVELCCWSFNEEARRLYEHLNYSEQRTILEKKI